MLVLLPFVSLAFGGLEQTWWKITEKKLNHWTLGYAIFVPPNSSTLEVDVSFQWRLKWKKTETSWPGSLKKTWAHRNPEWQYIPMLAATISIWPIKMVILGYLPIPSHSWCLLRTVHAVANLRLSLRRRPERKSETPQRLLEFGVRATKTGEFAMKNGGVAVKIDGFAVKIVLAF